MSDEPPSGISDEPDVRHPNFFVVGASRSGTTSLWQYLSQHPDIFLPAGDMTAKEPSYFCDLKPCWARAYRDLESYLALFADAKQERAVGEASTPYLVAPEAAHRLRRVYPDARIVIVLRNPPDRAYSLYRYLCALGVEWIPTFERALEMEAERLRDETFRLQNPFWYYGYLYFTTGLYAAQLKRYLAAFPREQVHILLHDDLHRDPVAASQQVYSFLGVDPGFEPSVARYNESKFPLSVRMQYRLGHVWAKHPLHEAPGLAARARRAVFAANVKLGAWRNGSCAPRTRSRLLARYREDILETSDLIGRSLDAWLGPKIAQDRRT